MSSTIQFDPIRLPPEAQQLRAEVREFLREEIAAGTFDPTRGDMSPSFNPDTIAACREADVAVLPGALTPTEVLAAWRAGADLVKVFPAGAVGGPSYIKALKAPLPQIDLVPTGGVNLKTAGDFIRAGAAALGVGADLVDLAALRRGEAQILTERAREFVRIVREARPAP